MAKPVVIRSFSNPNDAYFAKALLEDAQIPVHLNDQNSTFTSNIIDGIKVVVPEIFVDEALQILERDFTESIIIATEEGDIETEACPKCNSTRIYTSNTPYSFMHLLLVIFAGMFTLGLQKKKKFTCRNCRHSWRTY